MLHAVALHKAKVFHLVTAEPTEEMRSVCGARVQDGPTTVLVSPGMRLCLRCARALPIGTPYRVHGEGRDHKFETTLAQLSR
jgi:hypothetical protein